MEPGRASSGARSLPESGMKFSKAFSGVPDGEIYPVEYAVGDECPQELEAAAQSLGALETKSPKKAKD